MQDIFRVNKFLRNQYQNWKKQTSNIELFRPCNRSLYCFGPLIGEFFSICITHFWSKHSLLFPVFLYFMQSIEKAHSNPCKVSGTQCSSFRDLWANNVFI